jgi:alanine racemase
MLEIAQAAVSAGANWLGTAAIDEARAVRSKITQDIPILVLGYVARLDTRSG